MLGEIVCTGCIYSCWDAANYNCPFCRESFTKGEEEMEMLIARVGANNANALIMSARMPLFFNH